jgi:hypothetical protein
MGVRPHVGDAADFWAGESTTGQTPMGENSWAMSLVLASVILASAIVYAAQLIASAIAQRSGGMPRRAMPRSAAGFPVEPSGVPVEPETHLEAGWTVLAFSQGRWWRAEVIALERGERVRIHYIGWDPTWDETVPQSELQVDLGASADSQG